MILWEDSMWKDDPIITEMNKKNLIQTSVLLGTVIGFVIGLIAASYLHKYIVHPLGF